MSQPIAQPSRRRLLLLAPLGVAALGGAAFLTLLGRMKQGTYDPHSLPSMLIGKRLPPFDLPGGGQFQGVSSAQIEAAGRPVLVNFFASWCLPCVVEAPILMALKQQSLPLWGIAYKDQQADSVAFLNRNGNPYERLARDVPGRVAIDWGVYGVPETYFVDRTGIVRWRWAGPMNEAQVRDQLMPLLQHYT